ncbi:MAG: hypothetical protein GY906_29825 [bacterium]|nr:hypothetical protein [bacterium]
MRDRLNLILVAVLCVSSLISAPTASSQDSIREMQRKNLVRYSRQLEIFEERITRTSIDPEGLLENLEMVRSVVEELEGKDEEYSALEKLEGKCRIWLETATTADKQFNHSFRTAVAAVERCGSSSAAVANEEGNALAALETMERSIQNAEKHYRSIENNNFDLSKWSPSRLAKVHSVVPEFIDEVHLDLESIEKAKELFLKARREIERNLIQVNNLRSQLQQLSPADESDRKEVKKLITLCNGYTRRFTEVEESANQLSDRFELVKGPTRFGLGDTIRRVIWLIPLLERLRMRDLTEVLDPSDARRRFETARQQMAHFPTCGGQASGPLAVPTPGRSEADTTKPEPPPKPPRDSSTPIPPATSEPTSPTDSSTYGGLRISPLRPRPLSIGVGATLTLRGEDYGGRPYSGVEWISGNTEAVAISPGGTIFGLQVNGKATILAKFDGMQAYVEIEVIGDTEIPVDSDSTSTGSHSAAPPSPGGGDEEATPPTGPGSGEPPAPPSGGDEGTTPAPGTGSGEPPDGGGDSEGGTSGDQGGQTTPGQPNSAMPGVDQPGTGLPEGSDTPGSSEPPTTPPEGGNVVDTGTEGIHPELDTSSGNEDVPSPTSPALPGIDLLGADSSATAPVGDAGVEVPGQSSPGESPPDNDSGFEEVGGWSDGPPPIPDPISGSQADVRVPGSPSSGEPAPSNSSGFEEVGGWSDGPPPTDSIPGGDGGDGIPNSTGESGEVTGEPSTSAEPIQPSGSGLSLLGQPTNSIAVPAAPATEAATRDECSGELAGTWWKPEGLYYAIRWTKTGDHYEGVYIHVSERWRKDYRQGGVYQRVQRVDEHNYQGNEHQPWTEKQYEPLKIRVAGDYYSDSPDAGLSWVGLEIWQRVAPGDISRIRGLKTNLGATHFIVPGQPRLGTWESPPDCLKGGRSGQPPSRSGNSGAGGGGSGAGSVNLLGAAPGGGSGDSRSCMVACRQGVTPPKCAVACDGELDTAFGKLFNHDYQSIEFGPASWEACAQRMRDLNQEGW